MTYEHPWYTQQQLLENTTNLESESTQKQKKEEAGQTPTKLYFHPRDNTIAAAEDGSVWTLWSKGKNGANPPKLTDTWRRIDVYCGPKFRPKQSIVLPVRVAENVIIGKAHQRALAGRFNLACYLGRELEDHEVCRHGAGGNCDHSKANLSVGCQLNNIVDSVIDGSILTTRESIQQAIDRLQNYLSTNV